MKEGVETYLPNREGLLPERTKITGQRLSLSFPTLAVLTKCCLEEEAILMDGC